VRIDLPVRRIVAYEDRAAFEREGEVTLPGGSVVYLVPGLSPLVSDAHLAAALLDAPPGAAVDDVRVERRFVSQSLATGEHIASLERALEDAADARFVAEQELARAGERRAAAERDLGRFADAVGRAAWFAGHPAGTEDGFTTLAGELERADAAVDEARRALAQRTEAEQRLQGLVAEGRTARSVQETTLRVRLSGPAGTARLRVRGLYPCALWRPSHEAHLIESSDGRAIVRWTTFATLWQRTGESWEGVSVSLSTARPGDGAMLPDLTEDRLSIRDRVPKPKVTRLALREVDAAKPDLDGAAPGVYDGGEARTYDPQDLLTLPSDGRPRSIMLAQFETEARAVLTAIPEVTSLVHLRARLRNTDRPLLAGPVTLLRNGGHVGSGDLPYVGAGEPFELSFGSDDRLRLFYERRVETEERLLGRDRSIYVHHVELTSIAAEPVRLEVVVRVPVSELAGVTVALAERHTTESGAAPDADGRVHCPVELFPHRRRTLRVGFGIEAGGDVTVPPPW
jgi:uncharacterized protein (TIGR02231 family)